MNCRDFEELIVNALYDELDDNTRKAFAAHAGSCPACARTFAEMQSTLAEIGERKRPDPGEAFWDGYWNRLSARIGAEETERHSRGLLSRLFPYPPHASLRWALRGALAVALIALGAVIGRMLLPGNTPGPTTTQEPQVANLPVTHEPTAGVLVPARGTVSAEACARQYIDDTQVLLLGLLNFDPETDGRYLADWSAQKARSRELIVQAASLKTDLDNPGQRRLRDLVTELEFILLQIATLETSGDLQSVELIQSSVKDRGVLLKINLEKLRSQDVEKPAPGACEARF
jgi:hypothetical protein